MYDGKGSFANQEQLSGMEDILKQNKISIRHFLKDDWGIQLKIESLKFRWDIKRVLSKTTISSRYKKVYEKGNAGVLLFDEKGIQSTLYAHSSIDKEEDHYPYYGKGQNSNFAKECVLLREPQSEREFSTFEIRIRGQEISIDRCVDSEAKLLEEFFVRYGYNRSIDGELYLYTDRYPCSSCMSVMLQFRDKFKNIGINVYHDGKKN
ncbi:deaminase domain-containing protein [Priestia aryabhattai]|uniref:deaminase domain-containing protein n=1 Tax=Priestia aryabhattai TaxID=412384 RepID=UPI002E251743|nr:deaminase domain-containing protein [Priestia aryabhattai]